MADKTKIEWSDATWNPVTGCTKVSPGCDNCYADTFAERWRGTKGHYFEGGFDVHLRPDKLDQPLRWTKPRRIFVNSMSDLFHDSVPDEYIVQVWEVMAATPQHTYQLLTKRHARMRSWFRRWPNAVLSNLWLGVSVENQQWADIRIPALLETPAAVRFISAEPLLGLVDLRNLREGRIDCLGGDVKDPADGAVYSGTPSVLDWVIAGGESGSGARPMEVAWARSLVAQCQHAPASVFVKQLGAEWAKDFSVGGRTVAAHGDRKGGNWEYWPEDLRIREFPKEVALHG